MGRRVLCCGTFDYLHPGHISFLRQARRLGSELFVVIARDENVKRIKGRVPDQDEQERKARLEELDFVDDVRLGNPGKNFLQVVEEIQPNVIALGYDQSGPSRLKEAFPDCQIVVLQPHFPEKYKSSLYRRVNSTR